jgi:nicotinate-nucleotide adenylyltransferase
VGHLITVENVHDRLELAEVRFVPNRRPPHKTEQPVSSPDDRVGMVRLAIASNPAFRLDLREMDRAGPSYALDTLRSLRASIPPDRRLIFILGADALVELETWHDPDAILAEFELAAMEREDAAGTVAEVCRRLAGRFPSIADAVTPVPVPRVDISSSDIRRRIAEGRTIRYLVPEEVENYIHERGLYLPEP